MGYEGRDGMFAMHSAMRQMTEIGVIRDCGTIAGERMFQLTKLGYRLFCETFDFREKTVAYLKAARSGEYPASRFADGPSAETSARRSLERAPTPEEHKQIIKNAKKAFRVIYEFLVATNLRPTDCLNVRISGFDEAHRVLHLEETTISGKRIKNRTVNLAEPAAEIVKKAIGGREQGYIFVTERGRPWSISYLSARFRVLRESLGLPEEVVMKARSRESRTRDADDLVPHKHKTREARKER